MYHSLTFQEIISTFQSLGGRIRKNRQTRQTTLLTTADDDETTLALSMVQVGWLISDRAFNLEVGCEDWQL